MVFVAWSAMFIFGLDENVAGCFKCCMIISGVGGFWLYLLCFFHLLGEEDEQVQQISRILMTSCIVATVYSFSVLNENVENDVDKVIERSRELI